MTGKHRDPRLGFFKSAPEYDHSVLLCCVEGVTQRKNHRSVFDSLTRLVRLEGQVVFAVCEHEDLGLLRLSGRQRELAGHVLRATYRVRRALVNVDLRKR